MSVLGKETAVSTFAETQLVPIIACVEMDIIFIKMKKLAWVGNVFIFIKTRNLSWVVIIYSNLHLLSLAFTLSTKITITAWKCPYSKLLCFVFSRIRIEYGKIWMWENEDKNMQIHFSNCLSRVWLVWCSHNYQNCNCNIFFN